MIIVNFKNYKQSLGEAGVELAKELEETAADFSDVEVVLTVSPVEIFRISSAVDLPVYSQHVDPFEAEQTTGFVTCEAVKAAGAEGSLINHSEHPLSADMVEAAAERCKDQDLKTVVCTDSPLMVMQLVTFADVIAYEPPELIGGDVSVTSSEPEIIKEVASAAGNVPLLAGAGVCSEEDVSTALELDAGGVLVSSAIVTSNEPGEALEELLKGF
ncbi:MAG: triose-phosphate isomerase [Patescibacteria group bacterium]